MSNDNEMKLEQLKEKVKAFCEARDWNKFHNPKELAIGISTEANELLQLFRFKSIEDMQEILSTEKRVDVEEELADVFFFILRFAETCKIDLTTILFDKMDKNAKKYPLDKAKGSNKKYNEFK